MVVSAHAELPLPPTPVADPQAVRHFVDHALDRARALGAELPCPGEGRTAALWRELSALGRTDLAYARIIEPHLDALAILRQAGREDLLTPRDTWAVWAAEGPGEPLLATPTPPGRDRAPGQDHTTHQRSAVGQSGAPGQNGDSAASSSTWTLSGTKPWCSLADSVTRAVVTAHVTDEDGERTGHRRAFVVSTDHPGFRPAPVAQWTSHGLAEVVTVPVTFEDVAAQPLGSDEWYLTRPGFAWGGMGVAAVWLGGAQAVADLLWRQLRHPRRPVDDAAHTALGQLDLTLGTARAVLERAAAAVDGGDADGQAGAAWALRVRRTVADAAETVIRVVSRATGPGPLTGDPEHIRRVESLQVYIRQDHAERDTAALGRALLALAEDAEQEGQAAPARSRPQTTGTGTAGAGHPDPGRTEGVPPTGPAHPEDTPW
ncbi:acyl-CoA dehydrogenase family protein [Kocuria tytonicola]|uniref:acyl-CoA dehydrogenase family protein n=1 Tax=Kocuria tytonicola TaxID=2055946 RepID=UPI001FB212E8|nr:acyl-CoA dehydrogenase family protein [Kocuria tytonicola]